MSNYVITDTWNDIKLVCCHRHEEPVTMTIQQGATSLFYACPKYHPENRDEDERACSNRISLDDYTKMLEHIHGIIVEAELKDEKINLTNHSWKTRNGIEYKILSHKGNKFTIEVLNKKAIR